MQQQAEKEKRENAKIAWIQRDEHDDRLRSIQTRQIYIHKCVSSFDVREETNEQQKKNSFPRDLAVVHSRENVRVTRAAYCSHL